VQQTLIVLALFPRNYDSRLRPRSSVLVTNPNRATAAAAAAAALHEFFVPIT
jgi:hypothetical protein